MGINLDILEFIIKEGKREPYSGSVLTLGRMDIHFSASELKAMADTLGFSLFPNKENILSHKPEFATRAFISDTYLFKSLGFSRVQSMDISDFEGADIIFDLCSESTPVNLFEKYDVIIDSGTSEHVFHMPNLFRHIFSMLRPGGRVMHISPSTNCIEHGYYMFSPGLFWDFYTANHFNMISTSLFKAGESDSKKQYLKYVPGLIVPPFGSDDGQAFYTFCVAEKTHESTCNRIPRQNSQTREIIKHDIEHGYGLYFDVLQHYFTRRLSACELRRAAFYGIGDFADLAIIAASGCGIKIAGLFDGSSDKWGASRGGYEIRPPADLIHCDFDALFITAIVPDYVSEIQAVIYSILKEGRERVLVLRNEIVKIE